MLCKSILCAVIIWHPIWAINHHFKKPIFIQQPYQKEKNPARQQAKRAALTIKNEIHENRLKIKAFLEEMSTHTDLMLKPLPIPSREREVVPLLYSSVLDIALNRANLDLLEMIVSKPFTDARLWGSIVFELSKWGKSKVIAPLLELCKKYNHDVAQVIEYQDGRGHSPLIAAAAAGHRECVRVLLEYGAATHVAGLDNHPNVTALHAAVDGQHVRGAKKALKIVTLLCKAGAYGNMKGIGTGAHEPVSAIEHARKKGCDQAALIMQAYALHQEKKSYFSLIPPELLVTTLKASQTK